MQRPGDGVRIGPLNRKWLDEGDLYGGILDLWKSSEGIGLGESDSCDTLCRYLDRNPSMGLIATEGGRIIRTVRGGHDGGGGILYHLTVHRTFGEGESPAAMCTLP